MMGNARVFGLVRSKAEGAEEGNRGLAVAEVGGAECTADVASSVLQRASDCHVYYLADQLL